MAETQKVLFQPGGVADSRLLPEFRLQQPNCAIEIKRVWTRSDLYAVSRLPIVLAPGGVLTDEERDDYEKRLMDVEDGRYRDVLAAVKPAIQDWSQSAEYDIQDTVRRIMRAIFDDREIWLGYSSLFPDDGLYRATIYAVVF